MKNELPYHLLQKDTILPFLLHPFHPPILLCVASERRQETLKERKRERERGLIVNYGREPGSCLLDATLTRSPAGNPLVFRLSESMLSCHRCSRCCHHQWYSGSTSRPPNTISAPPAFLLIPAFCFRRLQ